MGKKHNKFKKHGSAKHNVVRTQSVQPESGVRSPELETKETTGEIQSSKFEKPIDEMTLLNEKYAFVRRDVRKLMIVLGSLVVLFVAIYFLNTKTEVLANLGDWVYRVTRISI